MTSIERTAYPRFRRTPSKRELRELYTPTPGDEDFVKNIARRVTVSFRLLSRLHAHQPVNNVNDGVLLESL